MPEDQNIAKQLNTIPIPPAALVIDMRNADASDDVLETLEREIQNLASDMDMQHVYRWRYLTRFLAFRKFLPLTADEVEKIRAKEDAIRVQQRALIGRADRGLHKITPGETYRDPDMDSMFLDQIPHNDFRSNLEECYHLIDTIRNERMQATGDLGTRGQIGPNAMNPKVQVIFLTDAEEPDTLSSAAAYATHLKYRYGPLEKIGRPVLDTVIIALNHDNQFTPPRQLISRLSWRYTDEANSTYDDWQHIDALILSEQFGHNAARIHQSLQPYIAELLLYAQLIGQPLKIRPAAPDHTQLYLPPPKVKETRSLPPKTYVVGIAAIEYSSNWGRRLLNFGLATDTLQVLQDQPPFDEQAKISRAADIWLSDWRTLVDSLIPDQVSDIPQLQAFSHSFAVASSTEQFFTFSKLTIDTGQRTAEGLEQYVGRVVQTYTISIEERQAIRREKQVTTRQENVTLPPTLQDALGSIPQIQQKVSDWKDGDIEPPLLKAQRKAERVLSEPDFFTGAQGSIPRARMQLDELSRGIGAFQNRYRNTSINLEERRRSLIELKDESIEALQAHSKRFPFLAGLLRLKRPLAWLTLLSAEVLASIVVIFIFAWLHYFLRLLIPPLTQLLDISLPGISIYSMIVWLAILITVVILFLSTRRRLLDKKRSALRIELYFWAALVAFGLLGLIVSLSAALNFLDLSWLGWLPFWSTILFTLAVVILLVEVIYYFTWRRKLIKERKRIIKVVRNHQQETADIVRHYIADSLALELLRRAALTDGKGNPGPYYYRMKGLNEQLDTIGQQTEEENQLATHRLTSISNEKVGPAPAKVPRWKIREEILDIPKLTIASKRLGESLKRSREELNELAEILVRIIGVEPPITIEREFIDRPFIEQEFGERPFQESRERHNAEVLLSTATALALRMLVAIPTVDVVSPLKERYKELNYRIADQFPGLEPLLDRMRDMISKEKQDAGDKVNADVLDDRNESLVALVTDSLAVWGQMLWEHKDKDIDSLLTSRGVMFELQQQGYDPQTVKALLYTQTVVTGISSKKQIGELYLLRFPSSQGKRFFQDMQLEQYYVSIPDTERLMLMYIDQYVAPPQYIPEESDGAGTAAVNGKNGHAPQDENEEK